jgi:hypothetical protein
MSPEFSDQHATVPSRPTESDPSPTPFLDQLIPLTATRFSEYRLHNPEQGKTYSLADAACDVIRSTRLHPTAILFALMREADMGVEDIHQMIRFGAYTDKWPTICTQVSGDIIKYHIMFERPDLWGLVKEQENL